ncbi:MAG: SIMPL domain-containing protein [Thermomicrobiales bacterium]
MNLTRIGLKATRRPLGYLGFALLLLSTMALAPGNAMAQGTPTPTTNPRTISVSGTGIVTMEPDLADIAIGVQNQSKSLATAQSNNTTAVESVTKVLTDAGIDKKDIQTSGYNISPISKNDDNGNYVGITGYQVTTSLSITVRDITKVGTLLDAVVTAGANQVLGVSFSVADPSKPASAARKAAVEDARAKADELAQASGLVVTGVVSIQETSAPTPKSQSYGAESVGAAPSAARQVPVSPGTTELEVDVQIVFEVTPANG